MIVSNPEDVEFDRLGSTSQASHRYSDAGNYVAGLRLTDKYGVTANDTVEVTAFETWEHTWGHNDCEVYNADCCNGSDAIYTCGQYFDDDLGKYHLLLAKYSLFGALLWNRLWRGAGTEISPGGAVIGAENFDGSSEVNFNHICRYPNSGVFVAGDSGVPDSLLIAH